MNGARSSRGRRGDVRRVRLGATFGLAACMVAASLIALAGALGGCGDDEAGPPVYTEADNGSRVQAAVGDRITIRLTENPSTGFTWTLRQSSGLRLLRDEFKQPSASPSPGGPSPALAGVPGTRLFEFEVTGTGTRLVRCVCHRTWEAKEDAGTRKFTLAIEVD